LPAAAGFLASCAFGGDLQLALLPLLGECMARLISTTIRLDREEVRGREAFTYVLRSGRTGTVHVEQVLEYNQDPTYLRDLLLYRLTLEAQKRVAESPLSKREIVRRLGTSAAQLYRLLDQKNYRKSVDKLLALLQVLNCDVDLVVRTKSA
jgi:hypothetical protein